MTLVLIIFTTLVTTTVLLRIRAVEERTTRWRLYAIRDELRWAAIEDRGLLRKKAFWQLDFLLTTTAMALDDFSLWTLLCAAQMRGSHSGDPIVDAELTAPENARLARLYRETSRRLLTYLMVRHVALMLLLVLTVIGPVLLFAWVRQMVNQAVKRGLAPLTRGHRSVAPA